MIESLTAEDTLRHRAQLIALLKDAVDSGASVGFLPPLATAEASSYWQTVAGAVRDGSCVLLVACAAEWMMPPLEPLCARCRSAP